MAYPTAIDAPSISMQGTTLVATDDHALDHRVLGSAVINLETKLGLGSGSAAANQLLVGSGAGTSGWQQTWNNGTLGIPTIGTPSITGGTATSFTATDSASNILATSLKTSGGSVNVGSAAAPTTGQVLQATSGSAATWQTMTAGNIVGGTQAGPASGAITSNIFTPLTSGTATIAPTGTFTAWIWASGDFYNGTANVNLLQLYRGTTAIGNQIEIDIAAGQVNNRAGFAVNTVDANVAPGTTNYILQARTGGGTMQVENTTISVMYKQ